MLVVSFILPNFIGVGGGDFEKEGFLLVDFTGFGKKCEFIGRFHVSRKMLARVFAGGGRMGEFVRVGRGEDGGAQISQILGMIGTDCRRGCLGVKERWGIHRLLSKHLGVTSSGTAEIGSAGKRSRRIFGGGKRDCAGPGIFVAWGRVGL